MLLALSNYAEAFSYLVLNVLWLKSDMATVVAASGLSRWLWLASGLTAATVAGFWLAGPAGRAADNLQAPHLPRARWQAFFLAYGAIVGLVMATARVILT